MRAKSGMFVPLIAREQVIGVLAAIATDEMRAFTSDELARVGELAAEAALALDRTRTATAPGPALERDRIVSSISQRVRSELDPDAVLRGSLADVGPAAACSRC